MMRTEEIDQAIIHDLAAHGISPVEEVFGRLTEFTWNQVFAAIDRLSRDGTLALQRSARFGYDIAVTSGRTRMREAEVSR